MDRYTDRYLDIWSSKYIDLYTEKSMTRTISGSIKISYCMVVVLQ